MHNLLKQEFLKKWVVGLQIYGASKKEMSILERKKAIKLSSDVAMASTRNAKTCWSRAVIDNASSDDYNKILIEHILGSEQSKTFTKASTQHLIFNKRVRSKKILMRSCGVRRMRKIAPQLVKATSIAKSIVKKRTQVLKRLLPGGELMDEFCLLKEALDYMISLRVQVDVMRKIANATDHSNINTVIN